MSIFYFVIAPTECQSFILSSRHQNVILLFCCRAHVMSIFYFVVTPTECQSSILLSRRRNVNHLFCRRAFYWSVMYARSHNYESKHKPEGTEQCEITKFRLLARSREKECHCAHQFVAHENVAGVLVLLLLFCDKTK